MLLFISLSLFNTKRAFIYRAILDTGRELVEGAAVQGGYADAVAYFPALMA
jgi:hypothetical protein